MIERPTGLSSPPAWLAWEVPRIARGWAPRWWLVVFCMGLALVYLPLDLPEQLITGQILVTASLLLALLIAPLEYALGALSFAFLAASCVRLHDIFQPLRWGVLAAALVILALRYFLRRRRSHGVVLDAFAFLLLVFAAVSFFTLSRSVSFWLSALKLSALLCLFSVAHQASIHLVEGYGPAAAKRLVFGQLAYAGPLLALAIADYWLNVGAGVIVRGWFSGYQGNPNACAMLLVAVLPWIAAPLLRRGRWNGWQRARLVAAVVGAYSLLLTGSRASLLAGLVATSIAAVVHANRRIAAAVILLSVGLAARMIVQPDYAASLVERYVWKHRELGVPGADKSPLQSRERPWAMARRQVERNPWLGMGFGISSEREAQWTLATESGPAFETGSSFWGTLLQVGMVGSAGMFLAILLLLVRGSVFAWRVWDPWFTAVYCSGVALTVNALFEGWLIAPGNFVTVYYWLQCFVLNAVMGRFRSAPVRRTGIVAQSTPHRVFTA